MRSHNEIANEILMGLVGPIPYFMLWGFIFLKGVNNNKLHNNQNKII